MSWRSNINRDLWLGLRLTVCLWVIFLVTCLIIERKKSLDSIQEPLFIGWWDKARNPENSSGYLLFQPWTQIFLVFCAIIRRNRYNDVLWYLSQSLKSVSRGARIISMINGWTTKLEQIWSRSESAEEIKCQVSKIFEVKSFVHRQFIIVISQLFYCPGIVHVIFVI